jgi:acyl transferase domain-containing protein
MRLDLHLDLSEAPMTLYTCKLLVVKSTQALSHCSGAIKANLGHQEGASGIAGVIKAILCLERGIIPPIAGLQNLNPNIDHEFFSLQFPQEVLPWPNDGLRRASVNSFGFGGTNTHVVLDDAHHALQAFHLVGKHNTMTSLPEANSDASHFLTE